MIKIVDNLHEKDVLRQTGMEIAIKRSGRRTLSLEVKADLSVIVRAPWTISDVEICQFIQEKTRWIEKSLEQVRKRNEERSQQKKLTQEDIHQLANQALEVIPTKVAHYAQQIGVAYGRITIRNQKSRWGSCSAKGNLNFNCLLMLTPEYVQDYVVVHELCHRKEMNHSGWFWEEVEHIFPDYRIRRQWLKEHGGNIISSMKQETL